jgi:hypothetical protein
MTDRLSNMVFTEAYCRSLGFCGFESIESLIGAGLGSVPQVGGVYVVLRQSHDEPEFLATSPGGWFKGRDPSISLSALLNNWVDGTEVIYIGKAQVLRKRVDQLLKYGMGKPVGHWGGRLMWQLRASGAFLLAWIQSEDPRTTEKGLLADFETAYGRLPFANLRR